MRPSTVFIGLSSFQALAMFRRGIFYTFLAIYMRSYLGMSVTETTLFETIPMILNILFQMFVWGRLTDKLQLRRSLIIVGEIMASVGHVIMWYAHTIAPDPRSAGYVIIVGLTIIEIFWSMSNIGWSAFISDVYTVEERNSIQGKFASIGGAGRIIGAVLGGLLYDGMRKMYPGWGFKEGGIFFASAVVMLVSVIPLLFIPEGGIRYQRSVTGKDVDPIEVDGKRSSGNLKVFVIFLISMIFINSGINSMSAFRSQYLNLAEGFAAPAGTIGLVVNVESVALIAIGFFLGLLGRKIGIPALLIAGTVSAIVSLLLYILAPSIELIYGASIFKGLADGCIASSSYAFASVLIPPEKRGRYFAIFNATFFLSWGLSATLLTGPLIDSLISSGHGAIFAYKVGIASGIVLMLVGLGFLLIMFVSGSSPNLVGSKR